MQPLMSTGRAGINVHELQNSDAWRNALAKERADLDRLKDAEYTGTPQARLIRKDEFFGMNYDSVYKNLNIKYKMDTLFEKQIAHFHGTNVSGIIDGNGNNSQNFEFRGIAPKVHFYTNSTEIFNQLWGSLQLGFM